MIKSFLEGFIEGFTSELRRTFMFWLPYALSILGGSLVGLYVALVIADATLSHIVGLLQFVLIEFCLIYIFLKERRNA